MRPIFCVCCVGGDIEDAVLEGLQRRRAAIEASDPDVMVGVGDLDRLRRAERQSIGLPEDDARFRVRLKQVGGQLEALVLVPAFAPEFADDLDVGMSSSAMPQPFDRSTSGVVPFGRG